MKIKQYLIFVVCFFAIVFASCASPPTGSIIVNNTSEIPSIQKKHSNTLSKVHVGMSLQEFRQLFPQAYVGGQSGNTTAYELIDTQKYVTQDDIDRQNFLWGFGSPTARTSKEILWFYFYKDKLVKWGRPQDWPGPSDMPAPDSVNEERTENKVSIGTGFSISKDGLIITAYHIIEDAKIINVHLKKGSFVSAKVLHSDPVNDLAVLKVETSTPNFLQLAQMRSVKTGDRVFTMGFPVSSVLGQELKYTEGVVSSLSGIGDASSFLQITVPIQPGNSGGPLVNEKGEVVGIITSTVAILPFIKESGTLPQNVNWAVKSDYLRPMIELPKVEKESLNRDQLIAHVNKSTFLIETK